MSDSKNTNDDNKWWDDQCTELVGLIDVFMTEKASADKKKFMLEMRRKFASPVKLVSSEPELGSKP